MDQEALSKIVADAITQALETQSKIFQEQLKLMSTTTVSNLEQKPKTIKHTGISPFDEHNETFTTYLQRLNVYFELNEIKSDDLGNSQICAQVLLSSLPVKLYHTLSSLTTPDLPKNKSFTELCKLLTDYLCPRPNEIAEQHRFTNRKQKDNETILEYVTELKRLSTYCNFVCNECKKPTLTTHLRSQFVRGVSNKTIRERLLQESAGSFEDIVKIALSIESSQMESENIKTQPEMVSPYVNKIQNNKCRNCGGEWPHKKNCPAKGKTCYKCSKMNHFAPYCRSSLKPSKPVNQVDDSLNTSTEEQESIFSVSDRNKIPKITITIGKFDVHFYLDTGSSVNIIDKGTYNLIGQPGPLQETDTKLFPYQSSTYLKVLGKVNVPMKFKTSRTTADVYVVDSKGASLLGFQTAQDLKLIKFLFNLNNSDSISDMYPSLFNGIGKLKNKQVHLHIDETVPPVANQHRRIPIHLRKPVEKELERLVEQDIIEKVTNEPTPWVSPLVLVPKPNNSIRLCIDMRVPNKAVQRERHVIPTIDDIISEVNGSQYFSKLDLNEGYHQLELDEKSRIITTFSTHQGLYRYKRLSFGISSAAEVFQDAIRQVIANIPGVINVSDDILIFGKSQSEHDNTLHAVLRVLQSKGLTLNQKKCQFNLTELKFYGFIFTREGIKPDPEKVEAFTKLEEPKSVSEVRSLLGMINYCGRFIPDLAIITAPLRELTRKGSDFKWGNLEAKALKDLKHRLINSVNNAYFDITKTTHLIVDGGPEGLGAILAQTHSDDIPRVIACSSTTLTSTQKRYSQIEREFLAIIWAVDHFKIFLQGNHFVIHTDHKPLVNLLSNAKSNNMSARIERLLFKIQGYNFKIVHTPGHSNPSDFFSRHPCMLECPKYNLETHINSITNICVPKALSREQICVATKQDGVFQNLIKNITNQSNINEWNQPDLKPYYKIKDELSISEDGLILRGNRILIPSKLQDFVVELAHTGHQGIVKTKNLIRSKVWFPRIDALVEHKLKECIPCLSTKSKTKPTPIVPTPLPSGPWNLVSLDFNGPFPNNKYIMVLTDEHSRYPIATIVSNLKTDTITKVLRKWFSVFGSPETVKTDNGPPFNGEDFTRFLNNLGCEHRKVTPLWPQANGNVERFMDTLKNFIQTTKIDGKIWEDELDTFLMMYRSTPHSTTGVSPSSLMFRYDFKSIFPRDDLRNNVKLEDVKKYDEQKKNKYKIYADSRRQAEPMELSIGDSVIIQQKRINKYTPKFDPRPLKISDIHGSTVKAQRDGITVTRNQSFFKKIQTPMKQHVTPRNSLSKGINNPEISCSPRYEVSPVPEDEHTGNKQPQAAESLIRHSTRTTRPPSWLADYIR